MIVSVLNQKGGVGKTTLSINLARCLTIKNKKTLLIDSDQQGSALRWHEKSNGDLLDMTCICTNTLGKDILKYLDLYEWIIIDGVPYVSPLTLTAIRHSDIILVPVQPSPYDIWATESIVNYVKDREQVTEGKLKSSFVISRQIVNTNLSKEITSKLKNMEMNVFENCTSQRVDYATSVEKGLTVLDGEYVGGSACNEIWSITDELEKLANDVN